MGKTEVLRGRIVFGNNFVNLKLYGKIYNFLQWLIKGTAIKVAVPFILVLLSGCASVHRQPANNIATIAYSFLDHTAALEVEEAYLDRNMLYMKYRAFLTDSNSSRIFYAKAVLDTDIVGDEVSKNIVSYLEFVNRDEWFLETARRNKIKILGQDRWYVFRDKVTSNIAIDDKNTGIAMRVDEREFFLYYDKNNDLKIVDIQDKPPEISISKSITSEELADITIDTLEDYLKVLNIRERKVLLTIANVDKRSDPFIFIDLDKRLSVSLKIRSQEKVYKGSIINKSVKSADHLILNSHVFGLAVRPFSSAFKLLYWGKSAAFDIIRPKRISFFNNKEIPSVVSGNSSSMDLKEWEKKLDKIVGKNSTRGDVKFLIGGDQFFPRLIDALLRAKKTIHLRTFIFDNDDYALKIADILKKKSNEGVEVKILLDGMGTIMGEEAFPDTLPPGFIPPKSIVSYLSKKSKIKVRVKSNVWFKADHVKTTVIDDEVCFTGGMNIGREYRYDWHDLMMEVKGPMINVVNKDFNSAWEYAGKLGDMAFIKGLMSNGSNVVKEYKGEYSVIRPIYTKLNDPQIFKSQIAAIKNSKKYIYINNAYFSDNAILDELIKARLRGVDVRVILPVNGNHQIMNASNIVTANVMFKNKIRVYFYPGMSHIKAAVYDGWLSTGSANFDKLSLRDNLEFNIATSDKDIVDDVLNNLFYPDLKKSKEMKGLIKHGIKAFIAEFLAEQL